MYVVGPVGAPAGFFHVAVRDDTAELRLGAADPQAGGLAGYGIYVGTMHALQRTGLRSATTKVSAANTAVLNLYVALGFTFSEPQVTFHWHAPNHLPRG